MLRDYTSARIGLNMINERHTLLFYSEINEVCSYVWILKWVNFHCNWISLINVLNFPKQWEADYRRIIKTLSKI